MSMDDFQILSKIGQGSQSKVYKVKRHADDSIYVMKKVKLDKMSPQSAANAINQVRLLASIRHPNVITYKQAFFDANTRTLNIVMQYADQGDLLQNIFQHKKKGRIFHEDYVWNGLAALHNLRITHGDLKSANVFLMSNGSVKIGDLDVSSVLLKGMSCPRRNATPYYASPQIWRGQSYNSKSDMWSLGIILYQLLHLKPPFRAIDEEGLSARVQRGFFGKINRDYSQQFAQILGLLINPDSYSRATCQEILRHPAVRQHMNKSKDIQSLQTSSLLKTIKPIKNLNYLTEKLPKPNYFPVRYRSLKQGDKSLNEARRISNSTSEILPKRDKSLNLSKKNTSMLSPIGSQSIKMRNSMNSNPQFLPELKAKWVYHF